MHPIKQYVLPLLFASVAACHSLKAQEPVKSSDPAIHKYGLKTIASPEEYHRLVSRDPQQELVELKKIIPGLTLDIRYATANNLMRRPMYGIADAFLRRPAAEALRDIGQELKPMGLGLKIYDGYRPYRVTVAFYEAYHDTAFVASPYTGSRHNRGCAVDLTLIDLKTGKELYMPTPYDAFTKQAAAAYGDLPDSALKNRKLLQDVMLRHGFIIYPDEWWHFDYAGWKNYPVMDIPYEVLLGKIPGAAAGGKAGAGALSGGAAAGAGSALRYTADWESLRSYTVPEWFRDAKFGIFIHWGVYSVPEFEDEWYPRNMYQKDSKDMKAYAHHIATYGGQDRWGYKDFIPLFKAEHFNADDWAELFRKAGAKYVVPVAEHHDGFAMYKTSLSRWNAAEMGPKRDVIGELSEAIRRKGLIFGLSSHRIEHWWFMNGGRTFNSDVNDEVYKDFYGPAMQEKDTMTAEYMNDWLLRCTELANKYHPQLMWFDWWIGKQPQFQPYLRSFAAYYYNQGLQWKKDVVINYKYNSFPAGTAVLDLERGMLAGIRDTAWQTDDAVGFQSWSYIKGEKYKTPQYLVDELVDIVSKNGNLLLNIGPRSDGIIPQEQQELLLAMGGWLRVNGNAIYGSRPWKVYGEGPTVNASGPFADNKIKPFTAQDIRYTMKGDTLFATTLHIPSAAVVVHALGRDSANGTVRSVRLLGSKAPVKWRQEKEGLVIEAAGSYPSKYAAVYQVLFKQ